MLFQTLQIIRFENARMSYRIINMQLVIIFINNKHMHKLYL
jgi:hypothetical protein